MIPVATALNHLFALVEPLAPETVPLTRAHGRILAQDLQARRNQPPFAASAMDGYAVAGTPQPGDTYGIIGESAAGHGFSGTVAAGQSVRIFTGAPMPQGATHVIIQEDVAREGDTVLVSATLGHGANVRVAGADFRVGDAVTAPRRITPSDVALLAAMNIASVPVTSKPDVAIIATGDELVQPGETPGPDQIIASNSYGLAALIDDLGANARLLPIARDNSASLAQAFELAQGADLIVTIGGASVGDHDLVAQVAQDHGLARSFYKVAMRPGKPLMAGRIGGAAMIGLPGNPVSAMVCGHIFVAPTIRKMLGLPAAAAPRNTVPLATALPQNGPREHYMRAQMTDGQVTVFDRQDSALLTVLANANALVVRPPNDPPRQKGETVEIIALS